MNSILLKEEAVSNVLFVQKESLMETHWCCTLWKFIQWIILAVDIKSRSVVLMRKSNHCCVILMKDLSNQQTPTITWYFCCRTYTYTPGFLGICIVWMNEWFILQETLQFSFHCSEEKLSKKEFLLCTRPRSQSADTSQWKGNDGKVFSSPSGILAGLNQIKCPKLGTLKIIYCHLLGINVCV